MQVSYYILVEPDDPDIVRAMAAAYTKQNDIVVGMIHSFNNGVSQDWLLKDNKVVEDTGEYEYEEMEDIVYGDFEDISEYALYSKIPCKIDFHNKFIRYILINSNTKLESGNKALVDKLKKLAIGYIV